MVSLSTICCKRIVWLSIKIISIIIILVDIVKSIGYTIINNHQVILKFFFYRPFTNKPSIYHSVHYIVFQPLFVFA